MAHGRSARVLLPRPAAAAAAAALLAALLAALAAPGPVGATAPVVMVTDSRLTRMVAFSGRGAHCAPSVDRTYIRRVVLDAPRHMVREMSDSAMDAIMDACKQQRRTGHRGAGFIFPGTKWCGPGNIAVGYNDLGELEAEDRCCREHDSCPSQLRAGECRSGLCNTSPFTASHCDCDARFRRCLQTVASDSAHALGTLYFNVGQVHCFKEHGPCPRPTPPLPTVPPPNSPPPAVGSVVTRAAEEEPCAAPLLILRPTGRYTPLPPLF